MPVSTISRSPRYKWLMKKCKNIDVKDLRILANFYYNQRAKVKVGNELTNERQNNWKTLSVSKI